MAKALMGEGAKVFPIINVGFPFPGTMSNIVKQFDDVALLVCLLSNEISMI